MDDMVVKSQSIPQHVADLEEVFGELRKYDMLLNLKKCTFGVGEGKFSVASEGKLCGTGVGTLTTQKRRHISTQ